MKPQNYPLNPILSGVLLHNILTEYPQFPSLSFISIFVQEGFVCAVLNPKLTARNLGNLCRLVCVCVCVWGGGGGGGGGGGQTDVCVCWGGGEKKFCKSEVVWFICLFICQSDLHDTESYVSRLHQTYIKYIK